jgi:hypothetical protein
MAGGEAIAKGGSAPLQGRIVDMRQFLSMSIVTSHLIYFLPH